MKTHLYTYEELEQVNIRFESTKELEFATIFFKEINDTDDLELYNAQTSCMMMTDAALRAYVMDDELSLVEKNIRYAVKWAAYSLEEEKKMDPRYLHSNFHSALRYVKYLRLLSISVLLGYDKEDMKVFEQVVHVIKGRDILLDTLLSSMTGCEVSDDVMTTNVYPMLIEIINEQDKVQAEQMMIDFMENQWWKNTGRYEFRDNMSIFSYTGTFAFETAAIAKIKGLDMSKFEGLKYFPIDMAYYGTEKEGTVEVVCDRLYVKKFYSGPNVIEFNSNLEFGKDFENGKLIDANFSNMIIENVCFAGSDLTYAKFYNSDLINCDFEGANMYAADIQDSRIVNCNFKDLEAQKMSIHKSELISSTFQKAILLEGGMTLCKIASNKFENCNMIYLDLSETIFWKNDVIGGAFAGIRREGENAKYLANSFIRTDIEATPFTEQEKYMNQFVDVID